MGVPVSDMVLLHAKNKAVSLKVANNRQGDILNFDGNFITHFYEKRQSLNGRSVH